MIISGSWKDLSNDDLSNTEWPELKNGFGVRETGIKILVLPPVGSVNLQEACLPSLSLTSRDKTQHWMVNAKRLAEHLVHARHSINNMFVIVWVSNETEMVPEVFGNLPNMGGKTRYRKGA